MGRRPSLPDRRHACVLTLAPDEERVMAGGIRSDGTDEFDVRDLTLSEPRRIPRDFASLRRLAWTADDELLVLDYSSGVVVSRPDGSDARRLLAESGLSFHDMHLACSGSCVVLVGSMVIRGCRPADAPSDSGLDVSADGEWLVFAGWDGRVQFAWLGEDDSRREDSH